MTKQASNDGIGLGILLSNELIKPSSNEGLRVLNNAMTKQEPNGLISTPKM